MHALSRALTPTLARLLTLLPLLAGLLAPTARADQITYTLDLKKQLGEGEPTVQVTVREPIAGFELRLRRSDGTTVVKRGGGKPGSVHALRLPQPEGTFRYEGELSVTDPEGETASVRLAFTTEVLGPLRLTVGEEDLDLAQRRLRFRLSRPAAKAHLLVQMDSGATAFDGEVAFKGEAPGTPLEVRWPAAAGRVLRIELTAYDTAAHFAGVELFPWRLDIPHEEVHFDSGRADLRPSEHGKLEASLQRITEELRKVSRFAPDVRLYVVGHTDTVGTAADNRALSLRRARAIATFFRQRGLRLPIYVEGLGEEAPRVATPDETPEERNRRTEYILAGQDPSLTGTSLRPNWRKL